MSLSNEILVVVSMTIAMFSLLVLLAMIVFYIIPMTKRMSELSRIMYTILRKDEKYENSHDSIKRALSTINDNIGSLSSSTNEAFNQLIKNNQQHSSNLPSPELSKKIRDTILENINIEVLMSKGMRIPNRESVFNIAKNVIKTYPDIDMVYIIKLTLSMVENYILNVNESQERNK